MVGNIIRNSHSVKVFVICLVPAQILSLPTISREKKKSPLKYDLRNGHKRIIRNKENKSLELKGSMVKCIFFSRSLIKLWFYLSKSDRLEKELHVLGKLSI